MRKTLRRFLIITAAILLVLLLVQRTTLFPSFKNVFKPNPVVVDERPLLVTQVKNIAQLMTVEAYNEVVVDSTRYPMGIPPQVFRRMPLNPLQFLSAAQLVLIVRGKVIAGVDLKSFDRNNIRVHGDSLFIQLPHAAVFEVITNPSDVETFIEKGDWDAAAATTLKIRARNQLVLQAIAQGALRQADAKARQLVYTFFMNAGYKYVVVSTGIQQQTPSGKQ
jgi:hypothetical protein